jgi:hypothetical protein
MSARPACQNSQADVTPRGNHQFWEWLAVQRSESMEFKEAVEIADRALTSEATLNELKEAASHLRTLKPDSAIADLVDAKIARMFEAQPSVQSIGAEKARCGR